MLAHQIDRLKLGRRARPIVLATTTLSQDKALCEIAQAAGIEVFQGSIFDVVLRLSHVATKFHLEFMAVVGGDDVFIEGEFVDAVITEYTRRKADFITVKNLPFGTTPFGVSASGLHRVLEIRADDNTDGWERFFTDTGLFHTTTIEISDPLLCHPEIRLDLDYPEDLNLIKAIYERLYQPGQVPSLRRVLRLLLEEEPALVQISRGAQEKYLKNRATGWPPLRLKEGINITRD
jgi:spore coat polysaccharide biosynthesis protein SpsF